MGGGDSASDTLLVMYWQFVDVLCFHFSKMQKFHLQRHQFWTKKIAYPPPALNGHSLLDLQKWWILATRHPPLKILDAHPHSL